MTKIKDSGRREDFTTGSVRDDRSGKGRFDLISPIAMLALARHYEAGCAKYGERNWEKGQPVTRFMDSAMRHLNCHMMGMRDEPHLAAALWNLVGILHIEEMVHLGRLPADLVDWPDAYCAEELTGASTQMKQGDRIYIGDRVSFMLDEGAEEVGSVRDVTYWGDKTTIHISWGSRVHERDISEVRLVQRGVRGLQEESQ